MQRRYLFVLILIFIALLFLNLRVLALVRVDPAKFIFYVEPGERVTGAIKVSYQGEGEIGLKAFLYDWDLDSQEKLITYQPGSRKDSLEDFIKFNPRSFSLKDGEVQIVRFTIQYPEGESGEKRGIVFFEQEITPANNEAVETTVITQIGTTIYAIPTTATYSFSLLGAEVHLDENNKPLALLALKNSGEAHLRLNVQYQVIDQERSLVEEGEVLEKVLLPGELRGMAIPLQDNYQPGEYNLLLEIHFSSTDKIYKKLVPFVIK